MPLPINYIEVRFFAQATEDSGKVVGAVKRVFPAKFAEEVTFKKSMLEGHYGNPIVTFETRIRGREAVKAFMENMAARLSSLEKESLLTDMEKHFDRGNLYIRLDKQAAFAGKVKLCTADPIHIRVRFSRNTLEAAKEICRQLGVIP